MTRRQLLQRFAAAVFLSMTRVPGLAAAPAAGAAPAVPILMFHKVDDNPQYPEDITSAQLAAVFDYAWAKGFCPVNISDIVAGNVDRRVPVGCKPLGITADDAHRSIVFCRNDSQHEQQRNARSFVDIFAQSLRRYNVEPRATFFLGGVGDDRVSQTPEGYFGNVRPLAHIMDTLAPMPGLEFGYHTRIHKRMKNMNAKDTRALLEDQMQDFDRQGVLQRVRPLLAYPFGTMPAQEGVNELARMGFVGAVTAFPGVNEARYTNVPRCEYNGRLRVDPFHIPRVCVGAFGYASQNAATAGAYVPLEPLEDFNKDIQAPCYVSRGGAM